MWNLFALRLLSSINALQLGESENKIYQENSEDTVDVP